MDCCTRTTGACADAETDLRAALALHESTGAALSAADAWWNLGFVAARRGDAPTALQHFDAAAEIYLKHERPCRSCCSTGWSCCSGWAPWVRHGAPRERAVDGLKAAALGLHLPEAMLLLAQATCRDGTAGGGRSGSRGGSAAVHRTGSARLGGARAVRRGACRRAGRTALGQAAAGVAGGGGVPEQQPVAGPRARHPAHRGTAGTESRRRAARGRAAPLGQPGARRPDRPPSGARVVRRGAAPAADGRPEAAEGAARGHDAPRPASRGRRGDRAAHARGRPRPRPRLARTPPRGPGRFAGPGARLGRAVAGGCTTTRPVQPPRGHELAEKLAELRRATADAEQARLAGEPSRHQDARVDGLEAQVRAHTRRASGRPWAGAGLPTPGLEQLRSSSVGRGSSSWCGWTTGCSRSHSATDDAGSGSWATRRPWPVPPRRWLRGPAARVRQRPGSARTRRRVGRQCSGRHSTRRCSPRCATRSATARSWASRRQRCSRSPGRCWPSLAGRAVNVAPSAALWLSSTSSRGTRQRGRGAGREATYREVLDIAGGSGGREPSPVRTRPPLRR